MKKNGYAEITITGMSHRLSLLAKHVDLDNPEQVKEFIVNQSWSPYFQNGVFYAYDKYVKGNNLQWKTIIYRLPKKLFLKYLLLKELT